MSELKIIHDSWELNKVFTISRSSKKTAETMKLVWYLTLWVMCTSYLNNNQFFVAKYAWEDKNLKQIKAKFKKKN